MQKWKPTVVTFIVVVASSFGVFTIFGTEVATGTVVGGNISIDTLWDLGGSPYIVMENVIVDPGVTLTIDPGVQVKFDPPGLHDYLSIYIEGTLHSVGVSGQPVLFTSNRPTPQIWDWRQVQINSSGQAEIRFSIFEYGFCEVCIYSPDNTITESHFSYGNMGINLRGSSSTNFIANNTAANIGSFLWMEATSSNTIENNTVTNTDWPIMMFGSTHNLLRGNSIENSSSAIELHSNSGNNTVSNNTITNATSTAIYLGEAWKGVIENNTIRESKTGIKISTSPKTSNLTVANNTITECETGIRAGMGARYGSIFSNKIKHNMKGIYLGFNVKFDSNSTISQNDIAFNSVYGMLLENVSQTLVYHNNFINNTIQGLNDNGTNSWDNGYPSGGNYWSDYGGADSMSGPNQDQIGADGIGDTPYFMNWSSLDRYPLIEMSTGNVSPPRSINAELSGWLSENVTISWNLSWDDGYRSSNVTRYDIHRSSVYDPLRDSYVHLGSRPNGTTGYVDVLAGDGNPDNYFYYVCAVSVDNRSACSVNQVAKFTKVMSKGWRLVSIPLVTVNDSIENVFHTVQFSDLKRYSSSGANDGWQHHALVKPYKDFNSVTVQEGYWMNVTGDSNLTIAGIVPVNASIPLLQGWNLIGYPSMIARQLGDLLTSVEWSLAESFDNKSSPYFLKPILDNDRVGPGDSIWIMVTSEVTLWVSDET
jgi:parallel beta-helix repeat protein